MPGYSRICWMTLRSLRRKRGYDMAVDREEVKKLLRERGLKVTRQRIMVLEAIASCPEEHLTAEEIFELVKVDCPEIGLATVYRTIQLLSELRLIDRISFDDGFVRYEMGSAPNQKQKHHHHHLICKTCGKVLPFKDDLLDELERHIEEETGFHVLDHELKFYGQCSECRKKKK